MNKQETAEYYQIYNSYSVSEETAKEWETPVKISKTRIETEGIEEEIGELGSVGIKREIDLDKIKTIEEKFSSLPEGVTEDVIKSINRAITRRAAFKYKDQLINERNSLVNKKFKDGITKKEERRLLYIRWQLDRIDDAEQGEVLDFFEQIADEHSKLANEVDKLLKELKRRKK